MKKNNWAFGMLISLIISFIISLPQTTRVDSAPAWSHFFGAFIYLFPFCFLSWFLHAGLRNNTKIGIMMGHGFVFAVFAIVSVSILSVFYDWLYTFFMDKFIRSDAIYRIRKPVIISVRSIIISSLYYFIIYYLSLLAEKQKISIEVEQLKTAQLQARLSSLKEQLSPHFLFNTLNTLTTLTREPQVKKYVDELANVYRYMLQYKENNIATLQQELNFIQSYLYIIKTRLENAICVSIEVDEKLMNSKIPPLTLQILVENVVKHNIATEYNPLEVKIYNENTDWLVIRNRLAPKTSVLHTVGIGLDNVVNRYALLFGREIGIEKTEESFVIILPVIT